MTHLGVALLLIFFFQSMHQENVHRQCACTWGLLGPQWAGAYYFNVLLTHTLERKLSKMQNITEYSFKLIEIWFIDKDIKGKSVKPNFMSYWFLERSLGPKRPEWAVT